MKTKLLTIMMMLSFATTSFAANQILSTISVSEESYIMKLVLVIDEKSDIKQFRLIEVEKGVEVASTTYATEGADDGIVLMEQDGRDVVKLISRNFTEYNGGEVKLDYLYNGINGKRGKLMMDLSRDGDKWGLYINGKLSTKLHMVKNKKPIIGVVGIKEIIVK